MRMENLKWNGINMLIWNSLKMLLFNNSYLIASDYSHYIFYLRWIKDHKNITAAKCGKLHWTLTGATVWLTDCFAEHCGNAAIFQIVHEPPPSHKNELRLLSWFNNKMIDSPLCLRHSYIANAVITLCDAPMAMRKSLKTQTYSAASTSVRCWCMVYYVYHVFTLVSSGRTKNDSKSKNYVRQTNKK